MIAIDRATGAVSGEFRGTEWTLTAKTGPDQIHGLQLIGGRRTWERYTAQRVQFTEDLRGEVLFTDGRLEEISFAQAMSSDDKGWDAWSWANEERRFQLHEALLTSLLGRQGRHFAWGRIENVLDPKVGGAFIKIEYR
jgi:hypothetical protein